MYGIFSDEGLLEGDFLTAEDAQRTLDKSYADDDARVAPICEYHEDQEAGNCESCGDEEHECDSFCDCEEDE